jgi:hypothetical protein
MMPDIGLHGTASGGAACTEQDECNENNNSHNNIFFTGSTKQRIEALYLDVVSHKPSRR